MSDDEGDLVGGDTLRLSEYDIQETDQPGLMDDNLAFVNEDHARLIPVGRLSKQAFHEIASTIRSDLDWGLHHRKFVVIKPSDGELGPTEMLSGYFRFNLAILPRKLARGWVVGSSLREEDGTDFLITLHGMRDHVRGSHVRFFYHRETMVMMLHVLPDKTAILNGEELSSQITMLPTMKMGLTIGNLSYRIEFQLTSRYEERLAELAKETTYWSRQYGRSFDPTPKDSYFENRGYQFRTPEAQGAYAVVSPCLEISTGNLYAVKRVQRTWRNQQSIREELDILKLLGSHVLFSDGDQHGMGSKSINDVFMILDPFAPMTLRTFSIPGANKESVMHALWQTALGIRHIHAHNIIHRDIKPENVLVANHDPLRIVVTDFGHATREKNSVDHCKGTIDYLAPEIFALKSNLASPENQWTTACDIYSFGLVCYQCLHGKFERAKLDQALQSLGRLNKSSSDHEIVRMTRKKAKERPDIEKVIECGIWPVIPVPMQSKKRANDKIEL